MTTKAIYSVAFQSLMIATFAPLQALLTASNAAIGGPATAAAMCTSRGWPKMVTPALLVGTLGYAIGTPIGMLVACILKDWQL